MLPILYAQSNDLQLAFNRTAAFLAINVKKFEDAAQRLLNSTSPFEVATTLELDDSYGSVSSTARDVSPGGKETLPPPPREHNPSTQVWLLHPCRD